MMIFGPLVCATTSPETVTSASASTFAVTDGPSTSSTAGRVTAAPGSPSSFSISMTSPSATLYCLPPVLTIAYIVDAPSCLLWSRCCPVSVDCFFVPVVLDKPSCVAARAPGRPPPCAPLGQPRGVSVVRCRWRPDNRPSDEPGTIDSHAPGTGVLDHEPGHRKARCAAACRSPTVRGNGRLGKPAPWPDKRSSGRTQPGSDARNSRQLECCSAGMDTIS